ncbi:Glucooligosaccharide oxidase [Amniculicola lignicola CBS 123094]|uniref:Glucooligosaccharide oxidase n=1 Tax=Amniculicola lignicola CBS 123094 TaxID=1392246 RepID=A0A6A5VXY6_9PLEO|nr:Glucooligosaccharide oxidase [Amniculicola lignicola CBS 123094]
MYLYNHRPAGALLSPLTFCLAASVWVTAAAGTTQSFNGCNELADAGFQEILLRSGSNAYTAREQSYWAANVALRPSCIVQPRTTEEVSRIVKVLAKCSGPVALRSGGHTQWAGANDVPNGVTIDLGRMTKVTYDARTKLASIQPGPRWGDVYGDLLKHRVCVPGGRDGNVGIGGFLTGGGNSYYAGLHGLACDSVANFEVVLANGNVVNANAFTNADLWKALKGGSGNFGIVTRFDMYTFPAKDIWGGIRASLRSEGDKLAQTMVDFTNDNEKNPEDAYIINYAFNPSSSPDVLVAHVVVDTNGVVNASAFEEILKVPVVMNDVKMRTMENMAESYLLPGNQRQTWFSLTFENDVRIIKKAGELHDKLAVELKSLIPAGSFSTQCLFQPLPTLFAERSVQRGGNVFGLDRVKKNALVWLITGATETPAQQKIMHDKLSAFSNTLEAYADSRGLDVQWQYLNYVDETQNPLKSYGKSNVDFIRRVAAKYDPTGFFQKRVVSGWKISKVGA